MPDVEVKRRFQAPVEKVWDAYTDHAGWKHWAGFGKSWLEKEGSPDRNGIGCVRGLGSGPVNVYEEIVEWEPRKRFVYRLLPGAGQPLKNHRGEVIFAPDGDGTLLTWRCRFDSKIPGAGWVIARLIERLFRNALDGLAARQFPDR